MGGAATAHLGVLSPFARTEPLAGLVAPALAMGTCVHEPVSGVYTWLRVHVSGVLLVEQRHFRDASNCTQRVVPHIVTWDGAMRRVYVNGTQVNGICYKLATFYDVEPL